MLFEVGWAAAKACAGISSIIISSSVGMTPAALGTHSNVCKLNCSGAYYLLTGRVGLVLLAGVASAALFSAAGTCRLRATQNPV
jgi:hypothetical protein